VASLYRFARGGGGASLDLTLCGRPSARGAAESAPVILPTLAVVEIASAIARAVGRQAVAVEYAEAVAVLPEVTQIPLTPAVARDTAQLAAASVRAVPMPFTPRLPAATRRHS
jgi:hypothetical protein